MGVGRRRRGGGAPVCSAVLLHCVRQGSLDPLSGSRWKGHQLWGLARVILPGTYPLTFFGQKPHLRGQVSPGEIGSSLTCLPEEFRVGSKEM